MLLSGTAFTLESAFDIFFWLIGIFFLGVAFVVGKYVAKFHRAALSAIGSRIPVYWNRTWVDLEMRGFVILIAGIVLLTSKVPLSELLYSVLPIGNFDDLAQSFFGNDSQFIVNNTLSVTWNQFIMTLISFLPYFLIVEIIHIVQALFCDPREDPVYVYWAFIPDFLTLIAANIIVLAMGNALPRLMLEFLSTIKLQNGVGRLLILGVLLFAYLYHVIYNMFSSDLFVSMMGAVIASVLLGVDLSGGTRILLFLLSVALGYGLGLLRKLVLKKVAGGEDGKNADSVTVICSLVGIIVMALIFFGILKLMGF